MARTDPRRLGATSSRPRPSARAVSTASKRVAFGALDDPLDVGLAQTGRLARQRRHRRRSQRPELELARQQAARAQGVLEPVGVGARRQLPPGDQHHHPQPRDAPGGVAGQLEARPVGGVDVLEHEQHRRLPGGPVQQRHHRLEQPRALEVGRHRGARRAAAGEVRGQLRREDGQIVRPGRLAARRRERRQQLADQLGPQAERRRAAQVERRGHGGQSAGGARPRAQLARQPRLADPRLAADHRRRTGAGADRFPRRLELGQLTLAAEEREQAGRRRRHAGDRMRRRRRAQPLDQLARLPRRRHAELPPQALGQRAVGAHRAGAIAGAIEALDQPPVGLLVEPVVLDLPARELDRLADLAALLRRACKLLEQLDHPLAVPVARRDRPVVLEPLEQIAAAQLERRLGIVRRQPLELAHVDPRVRARRARPTRSPSTTKRVAELAAQRPQRAAQARPRALVEHVGPEAAGQLAPRDRPRRQRQVREHRPRALRSGRVDHRPVQLDLERPKQACAQHASSLPRALTLVLTARWTAGRASLPGRMAHTTTTRRTP